ncbi:MAG: SusC/RagA family TonB-linked outer membrane protein [Mucilaginibacter sp.]
MRKIYLLLSVMLLFSALLKAQNRTVTGTVTDEKSEPVPGASIQVKGSTAGTITDVNGKYSIKVTNLQNVVIGVKFIGYNYQEKTLKPGELSVSFQLAPSTNDLNEVVVVGYGEQKKATLTGAVGTIAVKEIQDYPNLNLAVSLAGQTVGLSVSQDPRPGQAAAITIRNPLVFTTNGSTQPIYIIDDQKRTAADFNLLDPNEIESISVLKDYESSIYGVSGGNGAILVRTKKGNNGAPKISFSTSLGAANAAQLPKMMSGIQLATWINDYTQGTVQYSATSGSGAATGISLDVNGIPSNSTVRNSAWFTPDELAYIADPANNANFLGNIFHTALNERAALNVSGGTDKVTYFIGADYVNQNSNFSGVNSNKYGVRANVEAKPAKGLTVSLGLSEDQGYSRSFWYKTKSTSENLNQDVASLLSSQPWTQHVINGFPVYLQSTSSFNSDNVYVPLYQASNNFTQSLNYSTNILAKAAYEIPGTKGLTATVSYNQNINNGFPEQYGTNFLYYKFAGTGVNFHLPGGAMTAAPIQIANGDLVAVNPNYTKNYQLDAGLNYHRSFGKHNITALVLYEQIENSVNGVTTQFPTTIPNGLPNGNFTTGTSSANQANGQVAETGLLSYIGRFNYDYNNTYLAQAIFRRDGSTSFAPGSQYGNFGGISLGWVISNENFIKNNFNFIDQLKVRASVGVLGSDQTAASQAAYIYLQQYNPTTGTSGGAVFNEGGLGTGIKSAVMNNPNITWDHQTKTDYGLDAQFLKSRLGLTVDYYWNHLYDGLTPLSSATPFTVGNTVPPENYAIANAFGYEVTVSWRDRIGSDWGYNLALRYQWSDNKNIREDLSQGLVGTLQDHTGKSDDLGVFGYQSLGLIRTQADADAIIASRAAAAGGAANVKIFGQIPQPGMINYADLNGDGVISTDTKDEKYLSHKSSNHNGLGFNWGVTYKSLSLNVVSGISWGGQGSISGTDINGFNGTKDYTANKPVFWADHWTPTNTDAKYPAPYWSTNYGVTSNFWFVSSFSANIQNANLSYTLPNRWTKVVGISSARLYAVCTNVLSLYNPYPDQYKYSSANVYTYPTLRTLSLGLNVTF